ncbi:hypothetical protein FF125_03640 [Aureibaculum algae]|uniref:Class IIb bacteriocin, lactobin A/cerein 7B family n=1 Tax=Aureibaculum algae TaxID=2584122 RepID=A0A5B7TLI2_9FLAO|nr:hypothetical protein [Aureibaculum algae]QCX37569.1 hypothetical protein FF125_03640 [Aureibaculum algae]
MKNLENYGVQEMNAKEIKATDGGGFLAWILGAAIGIAENAVGGLRHSNIHKGTGLIVGQKW